MPPVNRSIPLYSEFPTKSVRVVFELTRESPVEYSLTNLDSCQLRHSKGQELRLSLAMLIKVNRLVNGCECSLNLLVSQTQLSIVYFNHLSHTRLGCDKNYHKKCAYKIPNNCTRLKETDGISIPPHTYSRPKETWSGRPLWIDRTLKSRQQVPHTFFVHTFKKPTQCQHCKKLVSIHWQL